MMINVMLWSNSQPSAFVLSDLADRLDNGAFLNFLTAVCLVIDVHFAQFAHDFPRGRIVVRATVLLKRAIRDLLLT